MAGMRETLTKKTYDVWAWFYDYTFGACVTARQKRAVQQLHLRPGEKLLDLGVGTGLLLKYYPKDITVVGIDLSHGMLEKADKRRVDLGMPQCHLVQGDAMLPPFAEASFDHIVITHVISVVSDPPRLMEWAVRLLKPGGRIVLLNHFQSDHPVVAWFERVLNPIFVKIGWKSDLQMETCLKAADVHVEYTFKMGLIDLWKIVVLRHRTPADAVVKAQQAQPRSWGWTRKKLAMHASQ